MIKKSKLFTFIFLSRRAVFVEFLLTHRSLKSWVLISILSSIQIEYAIYIIILRPFVEIQYNIIENINEIYLTLLLESLIHLNAKQC